MQIPIVDTLKYEPDEAEAQEDNDEGQSVLVELFYVGIEGNGKQRHVLRYKDNVEKQLPDQSRNMLKEGKVSFSSVNPF